MIWSMRGDLIRIYKNGYNFHKSTQGNVKKSVNTIKNDYYCTIL